MQMTQSAPFLIVILQWEGVLASLAGGLEESTFISLNPFSVHVPYTGSFSINYLHYLH